MRTAIFFSFFTIFFQIFSDAGIWIFIFFTLLQPTGTHRQEYAILPCFPRGAVSCSPTPGVLPSRRGKRREVVERESKGEAKTRRKGEGQEEISGQTWNRV